MISRQRIKNFLSSRILSLTICFGVLIAVKHIQTKTGALNCCHEDCYEQDKEFVRRNAENAREEKGD